MEKEEIYLDRLENRHIAMTSYASLTDQAEDQAYDELPTYIQDELDNENARELLMNIAEIWQQKGTTAEKYGLIGDIFQRIVDSNAETKMKAF